ncbi:MAG TPA: hypothetical protein VIH42_12100 [Thermoguttaceae bacterium]
MTNFQRNGAASNTHVGRKFEACAQKFFAAQEVPLDHPVSVDIGVDGKRKTHNFDLGNRDKRIIVECKSHTWTKSENTPSAKITTWDQAMYFFHLAPKDYRKIFFVLRHYSKKHGCTLAKYYLDKKDHLIPQDVEVWEFDEHTGNAKRIDESKQLTGAIMA